MWELYGKIQSGIDQTLATTIAVSGVTTGISGNNLFVRLPFAGQGPDEAARRALGEAQLVIAVVGFDQNRPLMFRPTSFQLVPLNGTPQDQSEVVSRALNPSYVDLATDKGRTLEKVEGGPFPSRPIFELAVKNRQLGFAVAYYQNAIAEKDGGKALAYLAQALEAIEKHAPGMRGRLAFAKSTWDGVSRIAQPFRHAPDRGAAVLPMPNSQEVTRATDFVRGAIEAFSRYLSIQKD